MLYSLFGCYLNYWLFSAEQLIGLWNELLKKLGFLFKGKTHTQGHEILSRKNRDLEAAHSKDFAILGVAVLIQCH